MKLLRRVIFWCHLVAGVVAGTIVLIMSVTGVLLTYEKQMARGPTPRALSARAAAGAARLRARRARRRGVAAANPGASPTDADDVVGSRRAGVGRRRAADDSSSIPTPGSVLGEAAAQPRAFFRKMTDWHRWLGVDRRGARHRAHDHRRVQSRVPLPRRQRLLPVVAAHVDLAPGPRGHLVPGRPARQGARLQLAQRDRALDRRAALRRSSSSGVVISYPWASDLVYRVAGEAPPPRRRRGRRRRSAAEWRAAAVAAAARDQPTTGSRVSTPAWARADAAGGRLAQHQRRIPGCRRRDRRSSPSIAAPAAQPQKRGTLTVNTAHRRRS